MIGACCQWSTAEFYEDAVYIHPAPVDSGRDAVDLRIDDGSGVLAVHRGGAAHHLHTLDHRWVDVDEVAAIDTALRVAVTTCRVSAVAARSAPVRTSRATTRAWRTGWPAASRTRPPIVPSRAPPWASAARLRVSSAIASEQLWGNDGSLRSPG